MWGQRQIRLFQAQLTVQTAEMKKGRDDIEDINQNFCGSEGNFKKIMALKEVPSIF